MATRSLNKVMLIGNLTRDPELRYTAQGTAVCNLGLATNRYWTTETNEKKEDTEFHRLVAWNKLAELCAQLLAKGRKIYVEGRLQTRAWAGADGVQRKTTEIVISDMVILDSRRAFETGKTAEKPAEAEIDVSEETAPAVKKTAVEEKKDTSTTAADTKKKGDDKVKKEEKVSPDEIPF
ncbi:single-stranded DNA-binding protein [Candidatus Microgenomates bacterium]|nr:single-stranded DNA-binding protein [Candidatus Microgenomates bacterium]